MLKRQLIIIPGLGDRGWLYAFLKPLWRLFGFDAHIFVFGWETETSFEAAFQKLLGYIDALPGTISIIGVSAGGTAAVNALASRPSAIQRTITVCSPYAPIPHLQNRLLTQSASELPHSLQTLGATKKRILSVYGSYDPVVPIALSRPNGIRTVQIHSRGHGLSIFLALTILSKPLRQFLKS